MLDATGLAIEVGPVIEVFDRRNREEQGAVRYHFVLVDYLCWPVGGRLGAGTEGEDFFFSSRRRHTRFDCDWSSDVCSSDLATGRTAELATTRRRTTRRSAELAAARRRSAELATTTGRRSAELTAAATGRRTAEIGRASCRERTED